jgi:plasmid stabilization system protein ParE
MRVRFTPQAERQYLDALRFVMERDPAPATDLYRRTASVIELLAEHPFAGHVIPSPYRGGACTALSPLPSASNRLRP